MPEFDLALRSPIQQHSHCKYRWPIRHAACKCTDKDYADRSRAEQWPQQPSTVLLPSIQVGGEELLFPINNSGTIHLPVLCDGAATYLSELDKSCWQVKQLPYMYFISVFSRSPGVRFALLQIVKTLFSQIVKVLQEDIKTEVWHL